MKIYAMALALCLILLGCNGEESGSENIIEYAPVTQTNPTAQDSTLTQTSGPKTFNDVHTVLKSQCLVCHGGSGGFTLGTTSIPLAPTPAYNNIMVFVNDLITPSNTRLLQKATGTTSHSGGAIFNNTSYYYDLISTWIKAGAPLDETVSFDVGTLPPVVDPMQPDVNTTTPDTNSSTGTYTDVHTILVNSGCVNCHADWVNDSALVQDRVDAVNPASSLLLLKATQTVSHSGGQIFTNTSNEYNFLLKWIEAGAPIDGASFDINGTEPVVIEARPGYDIPTIAPSSFTKKHKGDFNPVQGQACITCHQDEEGKDIIRFGGTLFSYINTPNAKYYQDLSSYIVNLVGNNGTNLSASTRPSGSEIGHNNFYIKSEDGNFINGEMFTAYIKDTGGNIVNSSGINTHSSTSHRDCNRCHSQAGTNGAPGRVLVPLVN